MRGVADLEFCAFGTRTILSWPNPVFQLSSPRKGDPRARCQFDFRSLDSCRGHRTAGGMPRRLDVRSAPTGGRARPLALERFLERGRCRAVTTPPLGALGAYPRQSGGLRNSWLHAPVFDRNSRSRVTRRRRSPHGAGIVRSGHGWPRAASQPWMADRAAGQSPLRAATPWCCPQSPIGLAVDITPQANASATQVRRR